MFVCTEPDCPFCKVVSRRSSELDAAPAKSAAKTSLTTQAHYSALTPEPIEVIEGWNLNYRIGNAIKYLARAGKKDPTKTAEDYRKAISYIQREINALDGTPKW